MRTMITEIYRFLIRLTAFFGREIFGILRQPLLIFTLTLGPFLILLVFGLGYENKPLELRTLFVVSPPNQQLAERIEDYATSLGPQLVYMGVTSDQTAATQQLLRGSVDLLAVVPPTADESLQNNQPVTIRLQHNEFDPIKLDYIDIFGRFYVNEMNRRVLLNAVQGGQEEMAARENSLSTLRNTTTRLRQAIETQDQTAVEQEQAGLKQDTDSLIQSVGTTLGLVGGIQQAMGVENSGNRESIQRLLDNLNRNAESAATPDGSGDEDLAATEEKLNQLETDLTELETLLAEFQNVEAAVLVQPFESQLESVSLIEIDEADFFAPAVIALLLQHLALTFGALSIVQERKLGTLELFKVSPISPLEILLSKYLSYMFLSAILALLLTLAVIFGLQVPMLGSWLSYSLTLAALIFVSIGIGFVMSLFAHSTTGAVQYAMIVLLVSVFFSGAFIGLYFLHPLTQIVSWAVPATYGIHLLQDIMLRGRLINGIYLSSLTVMGIAFFLLAWLLLRRTMSRI